MQSKSHNTHKSVCTYTLKCTLSPYGRVALVKWHLPNVALKHKSSAQHNWVWCSLTAAASDTISALFTHAQTQHIQIPRGKKILLRDCSFIAQETQWSYQLKLMKESTLFQKCIQTFCNWKEKKRGKRDNCRNATYICSVQYGILYVNVYTDFRDVVDGRFS